MHFEARSAFASDFDVGHSCLATLCDRNYLAYNDTFGGPQFGLTSSTGMPFLKASRFLATADLLTPRREATTHTAALIHV